MLGSIACAPGRPALCWHRRHTYICKFTVNRTDRKICDSVGKPCARGFLLSSTMALYIPVLHGLNA